ARLSPVIEAGPREAPRILFVDDSADLRAYIGSLLAKRFRVRTAADGEQGLDAALSWHPDLVVADVMMPRMTGHALCRALKANKMLAHVPVILMTARAGAEQVIDGLAAGADDYLTKPV